MSLDIFEYYIERNKDANWAETFKSTSNKNNGKTFIYINTNYRSIYAFEDIFYKFLEYNGKKREEWSIGSHGQEVAKQWVINMTQSKFFKKDKHVYTLTAKGESFKLFLDSEPKENTKWVIIYLFLQNAYFGMKPNYISKKVEEILKTFYDVGLTKNDIENKIKEVLIEKNISLLDLFKKDIFWLLSFYKDEDFLKIYLSSTEEEKEKLYQYAVTQYKNKLYMDVISYKYKPSGQYAKNTFIDDLKILYFTYKTLNNKPQNLTDYISDLFEEYEKLYVFDKKTAVNFVENNINVFQTIFKETFGDIEDDLINDYVYQDMSEQNITEDKIDDTSAANETRIRQISSVLKRMAKERVNYICELDTLFDCKYFTSKENNKNYLEIHHLVPREFSNEFEKSIEIIDNYTALCPHCHRLLHFATDREREAALRFLFNKRKEALEAKGIIVEFKQLKEFYNIEE